MRNISAHALAQAVNKEYGNTYAWVINERTIGLAGGTVINIIGYLDGEKCALEAWNMNSGNIWNKGFDTKAEATFEDAVDYIASRVLITTI